MLLLTLLVYWPGLRGGLLLDDHENLRLLDDLSRGAASWEEIVFGTYSGPLRRPVAMLSFVGDMLLHGPDIWAFKYTNLMIHLLCGVLVFWLSARLFSVLNPSSSQDRVWMLSLSVAAMWLLSPLLVSTTLYVVQRMTQLAALFSFAGMLAYVHGRSWLATRPFAAWSAILSSVVLWLPLAALSKENGLLLPLLLLTIEIFAFRFVSPQASRKWLYGFFLVFLAFPASLAVLKLIVDPAYFVAGYAGRSFTMTERVLTEFRVLFFYLSNLIVPHGSGMGLFHDDYVASKGLLTPLTTLLSTIGWVLVLVFAVATRRRTVWPLFFGVIFFLAGHSLESGFVPLELVFEHRNYLPSFGIFFSLALALDRATTHFKSVRKAAVLLLLLPMIYAFGTYQRADTWSSWDRILLSGEAAHPNSPRIHAELASLYAEAGQLGTALTHLEKIVALNEAASSAVSLHRIILYCRTNTPIPPSVYQSIPPRMVAGDAGTYAINTLRGINALVYQSQCPNLNIAALSRKLEAWATNAPNDEYGGRVWDIHYETAQLLFYIGYLDAAIGHLAQANLVAPNRPEPLLVMMRYHLVAARPAMAKNALFQLRAQFSHPTPEQARIIARYSNFISALDRQTQENRP